MHSLDNLNLNSFKLELMRFGLGAREKAIRKCEIGALNRLLFFFLVEKSVTIMFSSSFFQRFMFKV